MSSCPKKDQNPSLLPQAAPGAKLTSEETSAEGSISAAVVNAFIGAIGGPLWFMWLIFGYILVGSRSTFGLIMSRLGFYNVEGRPSS